MTFAKILRFQIDPLANGKKISVTCDFHMVVAWMCLLCSYVYADAYVTAQVLAGKHGATANWAS